MARHLSEGLMRFDRLVERQMLLHEERSKLAERHDIAEEVKGPYHFITISRDVGAWGDAIASELAKQLQWKVYDKEIVDYIATESRVLRTMVEQLDETIQSRVHDSVERILSMFQGPGFSNDVYHVSLIKALAALAAQGRCILLGHGGAYVLQEQAGLHVRVTASLPVRVRRMSRRWGLSLDQTQRIIHRRDQNRKQFIQHHFMLDRDDLRFFHLVINTDRFAVDYAVAAILGILEQSKLQIDMLQPPVFNNFGFQSSEQAPG
jgi:cytidylate kinase